MIGKVLRGRDVGGLLRYLYGPGRANEHSDPHLVASWDDAPVRLEPALTPSGRHDVRQLTGLLEQPLAAAVRPPDRPVWHCALRVAPGDRRLGDAEWQEVARDVVHATGLAPRGDDGACRWVAVRHADDHVHLVVTLARQDGAPVRVSNDYYRVGQACQAAERRLGLTRTAPRDRTAPRRPTRGEAEKATRQRRREPARSELRRTVKVTAAAAPSAAEFLTGLERAGLLVRIRYSEHDPTLVTGFAVALPGDRGRGGRPVWFGGGRLAADLTWPKLAARWSDARPPSAAGHNRLSRRERAAVWRHACDAATATATYLRHATSTDPGAAADAAHATGDLLSVAARVVEGRRGGVLTAAADAFDRAARDLHGRPPRPTPTGSALRTAARLLATAGRASRDEATQVLALTAELLALLDAVAHLRDVQDRAAQARAARDAAEHLQIALPPRPPTEARSGIHTPAPRPGVPNARPAPTPPSRPRGRVRP